MIKKIFSFISRRTYFPSDNKMDDEVFYGLAEKRLRSKIELENYTVQLNKRIIEIFYNYLQNFEDVKYLGEKVLKNIHYKVYKYCNTLIYINIQNDYKIILLVTKISVISIRFSSKGKQITEKDAESGFVNYFHCKIKLEKLDYIVDKLDEIENKELIAS